MNRKEMIIVGIVLLFTFISGAFAAPAVSNVFVTNFPSNQGVTVTNFPKTVAEKTIPVISGLNFTLRGCGSSCVPQVLASTPVNSSFGFRNAFVYIHWDAVSPGMTGLVAQLQANQKPSADFPGDACYTQACVLNLSTSGAGTLGRLTGSMFVAITGEQFVFYLQPEGSTTQSFTNMSLSVFVQT